MLSASDAYDDFEDEEPLRPRRWGGPTGAIVPAFVAIHGAYHVLTQRLEMETRDHGFSASEAVVLVMARSHPMAAIAVVRHATGLRRSTMTSILDRLEDRGYIRRIRDPHDHRYSHLELTHSGMESADAATAADI